MRVMRSYIVASICFIVLGMTSCLDKDTGIDTEAQTKMDLETIDNYIAANGLNAVKDKNGIRYVIDELGKGLTPRLDQVIVADYVGKFLDGTTFDDGEAKDIPLGGYIRGWQFGLSAWPEGTKGKLFVPSTLAYGTKQVNSVPPNSVLVFDINLKDIALSNAEKARFTSDTTEIDDFLDTRDIVAEKDSSGVRYVITDPGAGARPSLFSKVKFNSTGTSIVSSIEFYKGTSEPNENFDSRVVDYINGIKVALMKIGVGGKITVYIPSGLAFGPVDNSASALPANSNVIYEVELLEIVD